MIGRGIIAQGEADAIRSERQFQNIMNITGAVGDAAKKAAAFMVGGPAGAAMASGMGGGEGGEGGGGGLFDTIINAYAKKEQDKSDAKIYGNLMKIIAPAFGEDGNGILQTFNELESDAERANFGRTIAGSLGVIGNMYAQTRSAGIREQQAYANMPGPKAAADNAADRAAQGPRLPGARYNFGG